ncbi:hypothetical protein WJX74_002614 [Apatococcus lobatus]|uniref:Glucose-6-phosphate 1-epimerase n=2 Tax=Apatococcus TaxID=904362 RepID=A0AAW1SLT2_9CHLO
MHRTELRPSVTSSLLDRGPQGNPVPVSHSTLQPVSVSFNSLHKASRISYHLSRHGLRHRSCLGCCAHQAADLQHHGIPGFVSIVSSENGLPAVQLTNSAGWSALVHLAGCRIASWIMPSGDQILSIPADAHDSRATAHGIVPEFPMSSEAGAASSHSSPWQISSTSADLQPDERDPEVELVLSSDESGSAAWPFLFRAVHSVSLHGDQLRSDLRIYNLDSQPVSFTAMLHSHIEVVEVPTSRVIGLEGATTSLASFRNPTEGPVLQLGRQGMEQVFFNVPDYLELDVGSGAAVALTSDGWADVIVRSPAAQAVTRGTASAHCCLSRAMVGRPVVIQPGGSWRAQQSWNTVDL